MQIRLRYFARARELAGKADEVLEVPPGTTLAELRLRLPAGTERFGLAVNATWGDDAVVLQADDEVAVLPPVSGGAIPFLTEDPIDVAAAVAAVSDPACGGTVVFLGTVRNEFQGRPTEALVYEAYREMAEAELQHVAEAARAAGARHVAIQHRLGRLGLTDVSVVIAVSAPHRGEAFHACERALELLKARVPIWKQEIGPTGAVWQSDL
jgi:molybdopterin synthase catalytic subunit/molybdopterin converting factor small subunit